MLIIGGVHTRTPNRFRSGFKAVRCVHTENGLMQTDLDPTHFAMSSPTPLKTGPLSWYLTGESVIMCNLNRFQTNCVNVWGSSKPVSVNQFSQTCSKPVSVWTPWLCNHDIDCTCIQDVVCIIIFYQPAIYQIDHLHTSENMHRVWWRHIRWRQCSHFMHRKDRRNQHSSILTLACA